MKMRIQFEDKEVEGDDEGLVLEEVQGLGYTLKPSIIELRSEYLDIGATLIFRGYFQL
jgi:hypothetical protein